MSSHRNPEFATTQWSLIRAAATRSSHAAGIALQELCQTYWFPVYAFIRRRGHTASDAEDLTQSFFVHFLNSAFVKAADPDRGRFRSFLRTSIANFLRMDHRSRTAEKRGGGGSLLSLDFDQGERQYRGIAADSLSADQLFERRWALTILQNAGDALRKEYADRNHMLLFECLEPHISGDNDRIPYAELCQRLSMSEDALKQARRRLRLRYRELLRSEILNTVESADEIDDELSQLLRVLS